MNKLKSWGIVWNESIFYSRSWRCPNCGWECALGAKDWYENIVGYEYNIGNKKQEKVIVECPQFSS